MIHQSLSQPWINCAYKFDLLMGRLKIHILVSFERNFDRVLIISPNIGRIREWRREGKIGYVISIILEVIKNNFDGVIRESLSLKDSIGVHRSIVSSISACNLLAKRRILVCRECHSVHLSWVPGRQLESSVVIENIDRRWLVLNLRRVYNKRTRYNLGVQVERRQKLLQKVSGVIIGLEKVSVLLRVNVILNRVRRDDNLVEQFRLAHEISVVAVPLFFKLSLVSVENNSISRYSESDLERLYQHLPRNERRERQSDSYSARKSSRLE